MWPQHGAGEPSDIWDLPGARDITCKYPDLARNEGLVDTSKGILVRRDVLDREELWWLATPLCTQV